MSTLSGIISTGSAGAGLGQMISQRIEIYGQVANIGTLQFARSGWLIPYESRHASLISQIKPLGVVTGMAFNRTFGLNGAFLAGLVSNANYLHVVAVGAAPGPANTISGNVRWVANATGGLVNSNAAATASNTTLSIGGVVSGGWGITDATTFKGNVYIVGYNTNAGGYVQPIWTSNTGTYTAVNNPDPTTATSGSQYAACIAANATTIISMTYSLTASSSAIQPDMWVSTDGVTWTARSSGISSKLTAKFFWNPLLSVWTLITTVGDIYTSADAVTFTLRTSPSGMPNGMSVAPTAYGLVANTANAMFVSLNLGGQPASAGSTGKILKITGLTSYSLLNYEHEYNATSAFSLYYDGTRLVRIPFGTGSIGLGGTAAIYTSTDDGATWTKGYTLCGLVANNFANTVTSGNTGYYNPTNAYTISGVNRSGPNNNVFASMSGIFSANNGHTTIPVDTTNYYLVDITNAATQVNPDYVGMAYPTNLAVAIAGYVRTV